MADYVTLLGAEQVQHAARNMIQAAEQMQRAAQSLYESHRQHENFMDDWLMRFNDALVQFSRNQEQA